MHVHVRVMSCHDDFERERVFDISFTNRRKLCPLSTKLECCCTPVVYTKEYKLALGLYVHKCLVLSYDLHMFYVPLLY